MCNITLALCVIFDICSSLLMSPKPLNSCGERLVSAHVLLFLFFSSPEQVL